MQRYIQNDYQPIPAVTPSPLKSPPSASVSDVAMDKMNLYFIKKLKQCAQLFKEPDPTLLAQGSFPTAWKCGFSCCPVNYHCNGFLSTVYPKSLVDTICDQYVQWLNRRGICVRVDYHCAWDFVDYTLFMCCVIRRDLTESRYIPVH